MKLYIILALVFSFASAQLDLTDDDCRECFFEDYAPVCGDDGNSYVNECALDECTDDVERVYDGKCQLDCRLLPYSPVCTSIGLTYRNRCAANRANRVILKEGECSGGDCGCDGLYDPVCGINRVTYDSFCHARCAKVEVHYPYHFF